MDRLQAVQCRFPNQTLRRNNMPKPRKRRVPKRHKKGPDDFDHEAYAKDTIEKLSDEKVAEMNRRIDKQPDRQ